MRRLFHAIVLAAGLTVLADGTIGAYLEEDPTGACELWYENFSPDWLQNRK